MTDPFATALAVLLHAPGSVDAVWTPQGGSPVALRAIRDQHSSEVHSHLTSAVLNGDHYVVAVADAPNPARGDSFQVGTHTMLVLADPLLDAEGLSWSLQVG